MSATLATRPSWTAWAPWTDKKGRLHPLRSVVFGLLLLPVAWLAARAGSHTLGARPLNEAIHSVGYWATWILLASLTITPLKAVLGLPNVTVVRRMIGNAALAYAAFHLLLYMADQDWKLLHIVVEIAVRFYLTIGFVALLGLAVLGWTSTDGWVRQLGKRWKQIHRVAYGLAGLAVLHFFLQSKADASVPLAASGLFYWLMLWRTLPAGRDRGAAALIGLAVASAVLTLVTEYLWYRFATHIDPVKIVRSELDVSFGLHPAMLVLIMGLAFAAAVQLWALGRGRAGQYAAFTIVIFALGAFVDDALGLAFGWDRDDPPEIASWLMIDLVWAVLLGLLGLARWMLRDARQRRVVDALGAGCVAYQVVLASNGARNAEMAVAAALAVLWAVLEWQTWKVSRWAAVTLVPLGGLLGYGVAGLL